MYCLALGTCIALIVHYGWLNRGEWHKQSPTILIGHLWAFGSLQLGRIYFSTSPLYHYINDVQLIGLYYLLALVISVFVYRLLFHPLTKLGFKGPWYLRLSKIPHIWYCRQNRNFVYLDRLHQDFGDFVRSGPSELTVFDPAVFEAIDGVHSTCVKSEWYDLLEPEPALISIRDKKLHALRRREWSQAFSVKATDDHRQKLHEYLNKLHRLIKDDAEQGLVTNISDVFYWFGMDYMGELVFSRSFDMLEKAKWHDLVRNLQSALVILGPITPVPWLCHVVFKLAPRVGPLNDWFTMLAWCRDQMAQRLANKSNKNDIRDLAYYLLEDTGNDRVEASKRVEAWLPSDTLLAIIAGSDPSAALLVALFYEISRQPKQIAILRSELAGVDITDFSQLARLPHLGAVINESFRLYPSLATAGSRKTTSTGININGTYIPPHTTIVAPRFTIYKREDCFPRGNEFIPERWTSRPELKINSSGFMPFGTGPRNCLGRFLALDIIRLVTARLVRDFDIKFPSGEDTLAARSQMTDQFVTRIGTVKLIFSERK